MMASFIFLHYNLAIYEWFNDYPSSKCSIKAISFLPHTKNILHTDAVKSRPQMLFQKPYSFFSQRSVQSVPNMSVKPCSPLFSNSHTPCYLGLLPPFLTNTPCGLKIHFLTWFSPLVIYFHQFCVFSQKVDALGSEIGMISYH